jgi:hypothetical protein
VDGLVQRSYARVATLTRRQHNALGCQPRQRIARCRVSPALEMPDPFILR